MNEYLQKGTKASSMRLAFIHAAFVASYGGLLLAILDIAINKGANLLGVAAVSGAIGTPAFYGKYKQASVEGVKGE